MDGKIDRAFDQRLLDFLCKQGLAADLGKRAITHAIARGRDGDNCNLAVSQAMYRLEPTARLLGLGDRQFRAACSKAERSHDASTDAINLAPRERGEGGPHCK